MAQQYRRVVRSIRLELRNVDAGYGEHVILKNVSFAMESGNICCLLGPNGVGKTTLFRTILGLMKPVRGQVLMDGKDTKDWSAKELARNIAYVSQFHNPPFPYKVKDVVLLGRISQAGYFGKVSDMDYEIASRAIHDMGVDHLADKPYTDISGGERQLVMIARALTQQPRWLMMDEPTASLDYGNMIRVISRIIALRDRGYGIVMTTHLPDQAFMCDAKVGLLQRGAPVKFGDAADIITEENMRATYGIGVSVAEMYDRDGHMMRMCVPEVGTMGRLQETKTGPGMSGRSPAEAADVAANTAESVTPDGNPGVVDGRSEHRDRVKSSDRTGDTDRGGSPGDTRSEEPVSSADAVADPWASMRRNHSSAEKRTDSGTSASRRKPEHDGTKSRWSR